MQLTFGDCLKANAAQSICAWWSEMPAFEMSSSVHSNTYSSKLGSQLNMLGQPLSPHMTVDQDDAASTQLWKFPSTAALFQARPACNDSLPSKEHA